jgi:hypothetical protein
MRRERILILTDRWGGEVRENREKPAKATFSERSSGQSEKILPEVPERALFGCLEGSGWRF